MQGTRPGGGFEVGRGGMGQGVGQVGEVGTSGRLAPPSNVLTGTRALPRPEADARTEAVFGMRRPTSGNPDYSSTGSMAPSPPVPGTSAAEPGPARLGGFAIAPGGQNIGTGGLVTQPPFGSGPSRANSGGL
jgi:hypothetical protein